MLYTFHRCFGNMRCCDGGYIYCLKTLKLISNKKRGVPLFLFDILIVQRVTVKLRNSERRLCLYYVAHFGSCFPKALFASLPTISIRAGVIVAVPLHEVNAAPNAKSCAKRDYQSLQYVNCAVEKIHINLAFCR